MKNKIETIIFDLGGVLIDWNPRYLYRQLFQDEKEMEYFLANVCTMEWNMEQDAGRTWADAIALLTPHFPHYQSQIEAYWSRWPEMLNGEISGTVQILESLFQANQHRLYALTNWSAETFPFAQAQFAFLQHFKGILVSGEEKLKKPDLAIYHLLLNRYHINPATAIFIDDSKANVAAAKQVGIRAIHFQRPEQLKADLIALGIEV